MELAQLTVQCIILSQMARGCEQSDSIIFKMLCQSTPKEWVSQLPWGEWWYNTNLHSPTQLTPFEALYCVSPLTLLQYVAGTTHNPKVDTQLRSQDEILAILKKNLHMAQASMKKQYDTKHTSREFKVGDMVYLLQQYQQQSVARRSSSKLSLRYYGPFEVLQRIGDVAYRLKLPPTSMIHPVFHVSCLKHYLASFTTTSMVLPPLDHHSAHHAEPQRILQRRMSKHKNRPLIEMLVKQKDEPEENSTQVPIKQLRKQFPDLEGKVF